MTIPHGGDKQKMYRVFCAKCGGHRVVEGPAAARRMARDHNEKMHNGFDMADYEPEKG